MKIPHSKHLICNCPELCEERHEFWVYKDKEECVLDESLDEAVVLWQENFVYDTPPAVDAGELHEEIRRWLEETEFLVPFDPTGLWIPEERRNLYTKVMGVTVSNVATKVVFSRPCPIFYIRNLARKLGTMKVRYPKNPECNHTKDFRGKEKIKEIFRELFREDPVLDLLSRKTLSLWKMIDHIILLGRVCPKDSPLYPFLKYFNGVLSPGEYHNQKERFINFIKGRFPEWRHQT